jgi:hypothetical protein
LRRVAAEAAVKAFILRGVAPLPGRLRDALWAAVVKEGLWRGFAACSDDAWLWGRYN